MVDILLERYSSQNRKVGLWTNIQPIERENRNTLFLLLIILYSLVLLYCTFYLLVLNAVSISS